MLRTSPSAQGTWSGSGAVTVRRRRPRTRVARWRPSNAVGAVLVGLVAGQLLTIALVTGSGVDRSTVALSLVVSDLVLLASVIAVASGGADRFGAATLGIRRPALGPAVGWGATLLFATFAVQGLLAAAFGVGGDGHGSSTTHLEAGTAVLVALGVAVTAPLAEEVAFRGYLFPALTRWRGPWLAAAITALLFGVAHFAALPAALLPGAVFFGFGACLLFWFTGSLIPAVVVHSINNAVALTVVTGGQLAPAIVLAPAISLLLLLGLARERSPVTA